MLIYHPAYDAFHCLFRLMTIIDVRREIEVAKLRIIDFYFLFPAELRHVSLPKGKAGIKAVAKGLVNRYHGPVSPIQTFRELEHIQLAAMGALAAADLIDKHLLPEGVIRRTDKEIGPDVRKMMDQMLDSLPEGAAYAINELAEFPLKGDGGLKHRTGLMEYRYDNV